MCSIEGLPQDVTEVKLKEQKSFNGQVFPLVLSPSQLAKSFTCEDWCLWVTQNKDCLKQILQKYGALFFRNFKVKSPEDFDAFVKAFGYESFPYVGGAAPRNVVTGNVFTANESPPECKIPFHHEMAQVPNFPKVLFFCADVVPPSGGQTSIALSNSAYNLMKEREPKLVERLEREGVCYNRVLPDGDDLTSPIGRGWQSTYLTNDRKKAEEAATKQGTRWEWLPDGSMRTTTKVLPAVRIEERTGLKTWFNSIIAAYIGWEDSRNDRKKAVTFSNGDLMPEDAMKTLEAVLDELAVDITWQQGDVMIVDNRLALHARRPFTPPRRILACLCTE